MERSALDLEVNEMFSDRGESACGTNSVIAWGYVGREFDSVAIGMYDDIWMFGVLFP
jgi:hypothetical protein